MPDFLVKQIIKRSVAYGTTTNWIPQDNLTIAVGYRANAGEEYKLLTVNGMPAARRRKPSPITASTRRKARRRAVWNTSPRLRIFSSPRRRLSSKWSTPTRFKRAGHVVFEYVVKREFSQLTLTLADTGARAVVGSRGRMWIDRELDRVLRFEQIATEIPPDFPITAASSTIDYDWVDDQRTQISAADAFADPLTTNQGRVCASESQRRSLPQLSEVWRGVEGR